jgi:predicted RNase H-like HicB family nuclease
MTAPRLGRKSYVVLYMFSGILSTGWQSGRRLNGILAPAGLKDVPMRCAIVIEKAEGNFSAYVPDLPGCVATGDSVAAVESNIREAIRFHLDGLKEDGACASPPAHRRW